MCANQHDKHWVNPLSRNMHKKNNSTFYITAAWPMLDTLARCHSLVGYKTYVFISWPISDTLHWISFGEYLNCPMYSKDQSLEDGWTIPSRLTLMYFSRLSIFPRFTQHFPRFFPPSRETWQTSWWRVPLRRTSAPRSAWPEMRIYITKRKGETS